MGRLQNQRHSCSHELKTGHAAPASQGTARVYKGQLKAMAELGVKLEPIREIEPIRGFENQRLASCSACQPPPSALNAAMAARADSVCAWALASEARSKASSALSTSIRLAAPL